MLKGQWEPFCRVMSLLKGFFCSLGYLIAENILLSVCQNILISPCVITVLSSLQVKENSVSCIIFLLSPSFANTHTQTCLVPLSLFPISEPTQTDIAFIQADLQYFYWMTQQHQQTDSSDRIYRVSLGIWHLWVLFFFPISHRTHSAFCVLVSPLTPVRKSLRFWMSRC